MESDSNQRAWHQSQYHMAVRPIACGTGTIEGGRAPGETLCSGTLSADCSQLAQVGISTGAHVLI